LNLKVILKYLGVGYPAKRNCISIAVLSLILVSGGVRAQATVAPDAGSLLRDIERNQSQAIPKAIPKPEVKKETKTPQAEAKLLVKGFKFQGNQKFPVKISKRFSLNTSIRT
jgi:hypothetical protein